MTALIVPFLLFCGGVILLLVAGDFLVRGSAAIAHKWGVPSLIVGLTIVAFGTSAPEMIVSVQAVLRGSSELAIGNVVGSNIANVLLVLGIPALIRFIPTNVPGVGRNSAVVILASLVLIGLMFIHNPLLRWQGAILFAGIILYLIWMFKLAKSGANDPALSEMADLADMEGLPKSWLVMIAFTLFGIAGLAWGGDLIVDNASKIAKGFGVSEALIGLTIVAIGTSLPELATVLVASWRGQNEVAIGNVLGSNIFNIFAVMGAASLAGPVHVPAKFFVFDIWVMLGASVALSLYILRRAPIGKKTGLVFLLAYIFYIAAIGRDIVGAGAGL